MFNIFSKELQENTTWWLATVKVKPTSLNRYELQIQMTV